MSGKQALASFEVVPLVRDQASVHSWLEAMLSTAAVRGLVGNAPVKLLRARAEVQAALAVAGGRVPFAPSPKDALSPKRIPSVACGWKKDRVLAEIDQDGFAFATRRVDEPFFNRRSDRRPRQQNLLDIVLFEGRVCIRKRFRALRRGALRWGAQTVPARQWIPRALWTALNFYLYSEAAALLRLQDLPFVPKVRHIDFQDHALYLDCLEGESLRHRAARTGAAVHDKDLACHDDLQRMSSRQLDRREVDLLDHSGAGDFRAEIAAMVPQINARGVAPLDIKLGNFLRGASTGRLYWIDFEISGLESQPTWERDLDEQRDTLEALFRFEEHEALPRRAASKAG